MSMYNEKLIKIPFPAAAAIMHLKGANVLGHKFFLKDAEAAGGTPDSFVPSSVEEIAGVMAKPSLVSNLFILEEDDSLTCTRLVAGSDGRICFVSKQEDGFTATPLQESFEAFQGILSRIDGGAPIAALEASFEAAPEDLHVLFAAADLYARKRMLAVLGHIAPDPDMNSSEVLYILKDGSASKDPRWLVSFAQICMPFKVPEADEKMVTESLKRLAELGLVTNDMKRLSGAGMLIAISNYRRLSIIGLNIAGAKKDGSLAGQRLAFLRGDRLLWLFDDSTAINGKITVSTIGMNAANAIMNELFTAEGTPAEAGVSQRATEEAAKEAIQTVSANAAPVYASGAVSRPPKFCSNCGKPLKAGSKFCGACGTKIDS